MLTWKLAYINYKIEEVTQYIPTAGPGMLVSFYPYLRPENLCTLGICSGVPRAVNWVL